MKTFKSSKQMRKELNTEEKCREYLEELRWHGESICPLCGSILNITTNSPKMELSKDCISVKIVVKDLLLQ